MQADAHALHMQAGLTAAIAELASLQEQLEGSQEQVRHLKVGGHGISVLHAAPQQTYTDNNLGMQEAQERMQQQQTALRAQLAEANAALACARKEAAAAAHTMAEQLSQAQVYVCGGFFMMTSSTTLLLIKA